MQLGAILLERGLITKDQLQHVLALQQRNGSRIGEILIAEGIVGYHALYQAVASHYGLPFVDLIKEPPEASLLAGFSAELCLKHKAVPWRGRNGKTYIATAEMSDALVHWAKKHFGDGIAFVCTSPFDIRRTIEMHFGKAIESDSRLSLWQRMPEHSALITMPERQKQVMSAMLLTALIAACASPVHSILVFIAVCHLAYAITMVFKWLVFVEGAAISPKQDWKAQLAALDEQTLPIYTILVPMYRETSSMPGILNAIQHLDYPASKLDVKLVLEADDRETLDAALKLKPRYHFDIIRVPASEPRTKPKACNYALRFARGELITIFDADDRPERQQLKKAVIMFRTLPPDVVCLQARLNYYNAGENWLTRFFALEYTILFHFTLYGLQRLGITIPLGGTSNHISLAHLKALGEWDPYNVTEDADLGVRLAISGGKTAMLDSYTMEEAPNRMVPWIRQRSRWIKGYMQTWLVHMRHPRRLLRTLGFGGFIGFQCFVGLSCFTFLTAPIVWVFALLWMSGQITMYEGFFPGWLAWLTAFNLALNFIIHWFLSLHCLVRYRTFALPMILSALLYPFYLILHSIASYKALWQLFVKPHFWEKTVHGVGQYAEARAYSRLA